MDNFRTVGEKLLEYTPPFSYYASEEGAILDSKGYHVCSVESGVGGRDEKEEYGRFVASALNDCYAHAMVFKGAREGTNQNQHED